VALGGARIFETQDAQSLIRDLQAEMRKRMIREDRDADLAWYGDPELARDEHTVQCDLESDTE
jgi:hypothetical protein